MKLPVLSGSDGLLDDVGAFLEVLLNLFSPETEDNPALFLEHPVDLQVTFHVTFYLGNPEFFMGFYIIFTILPIVSVPELAVAEHCNLLSNKSNVGSAWNIFDIFTIMEATGP